jgi:hypothetical protein
MDQTYRTGGLFLFSMHIASDILSGGLTDFISLQGVDM